MNKNVLWKSDSFAKNFGAICLIIIAVTMFWKIYQLPSNGLSGLVYLVALFFLYLALNIFLSRDILVTKNGINIGNRYYLKEPKSNVGSFSTLVIMFKKSRFFSWNEIKTIKKKDNVYLKMYRFGIPITRKQTFYQIITKNGEEFWVPADTESIKRRVISLDRLITSRGKKRLMVDNPQSSEIKTRLVMVSMVILIYLYMVTSIGKY